MVVVAGILFLVMVFGFLIYIVISVVDTIDTDSEREEIIKDFFRYFRKLTHAQKILLLLSINFLLFIMFLPSIGRSMNIIIFGLLIKMMVRDLPLGSKPMATR